MNRTTGKALAVAAAVLFLATGCTDPTVAPKGTVGETNIFRDPTSYRAFIARVYTGLAVSGQRGAAGDGDISGIDEGFSQYLRLYWEAEELPTDEAIIGWNDPGLPEMNNMTWGATNPFVNAMYYRIYFQVGMANEFLRQTTDAILTARGVGSTLRNEITQYRAEARFLRALSYWHGIDLFGDIPLVTENDALGNTPPAQATRANIYAFIVSELQAIQADLPAATAANYGRATTQAAHMLLAKLYLNAAVYTGTQNYAGALAEATTVINSGAYSLDPSYAHLFQADNNTSPEIIFAIPQDGLRTQTWGGMTFVIHASVGGNMNAGNYGIDGGWWGLRLKPEAYNRYPASGDARSASFVQGNTVAVSNVGDFYSGVAAPKFTNKTSGGANGSHPTHVDTDFPMFRLADAYLIYAEAAVRTNTNLAQALTYVNALRQRAYGNTNGNITAPQLTLAFILDERSRELLWEAHRRTDLVRFGQFAGATATAQWAYKGCTSETCAAQPNGKFNLYPLPANELVANPNLTQNPGY